MTPDERPVVVIGSGPAGAMAAHTLVKQGVPVTMLESGQHLPSGLLVRLMGRNVLRKRPSVPDVRRHVATGDPRAAWYHALVPGGLSNYWTGAVPRFAPEDFDEGERLHERYRWPVRYEDLAPYYTRAERLLGVVAGPIDVPGLPAPVGAYERRLPPAWRNIAECARSGFGQGLTALPIADGPPWMVSRIGVAFNSYTRIVCGLERDRHFRLLLGAHALRLEWNGNRRRVDSVVYFDRATRVECRLEASAVVLAAGPLSSTKLLLASVSSEFPHGLGETAGLLGRYLHDHAHDMCILDVEPTLPRLPHAAYLTRAPYSESEPLRAAACTIGNSTSRRDKILTFTPLKTHRFGVIIFGTMIPTPHNCVSLDSQQVDELGQNKLQVHIEYDKDVLQTVRMARARLIALLEASGYKCRVSWSLPELTPGSAVHYGGTVRMHESPEYGLLNGYNRLHQVSNVAVVDASAFTTGVEKNPTLTVMALAARAADKLAADLRA